MTGPRILVVDDESHVREGLERLLRQSGYVVDTATDGKEALVVASERPPEVVITDLNMPVMDGVQLCAKLRESDRELPVIFATGIGEVPSAVTAMRAGATDYLVKPVDFDALVVAIERAREARKQSVYHAARRVAASRGTVLVTGESGTGEGELARAIRALSPRAVEPFVSLHGAAISVEARARLLAGRWHGNVRELEDAIERAVVLGEGTRIGVSDLPTEERGGANRTLHMPGATLAELERWAILTTLDATGGSTARTAEMLDVSVRTIQYRLGEYRPAKG